MNPKETKALLGDFYTMMAMVGLKEKKGNVFVLPGDTLNVRARVEVSPALEEALGGKLQAAKILRYCEIAKVACSRDETIFGVISASFLRVVETYPVLRSYYEMAKIGANAHTWYRRTTIK